ncbi:glycosyltransferase [uncultured Sphaerochaeta sp.]|uniref:glycosyltransferase n=1 Tax=uncultured Sphaerochaeta sp. TaxID=886478 RepID=UPI002AA7BAA7|nr:glycosyltransferase [uncultured Sphaerochaeta sp.]
MILRKPRFSQAGVQRSRYLIDYIGDNVEIVSLSIPSKKGVFKSIKVSDNSIYNNIRSYYYPSSVSKFGLKYITILLSVMFYLLKNLKRNDIIICYNANILYILPVMICRIVKRRRIKIIYEIEELYSKSKILTGFKAFLMKLTESYMLRFSDSYIVVNERICDFLPQKKNVLINSGYYINNSVRKIDENNQNIITYCGRLDYEGGIEVLLESLLHLKSRFKLLVTGDGEYRDKVEKFQLIHSSIDIEYLGFVSQSELDSILTKTKVCVNPLRGKCDFSKYSFPSKVLMYLAYGCNVISSESESVRSLVSQFKNLSFYSNDSAIKLAEAIETALSQSIIREENLDLYRKYMKKQGNALYDYFNHIK